MKSFFNKFRLFQRNNSSSRLLDHVVSKLYKWFETMVSNFAAFWKQIKLITLLIIIWKKCTKYLDICFINVSKMGSHIVKLIFFYISSQCFFFPWTFKKWPWTFLQKCARELQKCPWKEKKVPVNFKSAREKTKKWAKSARERTREHFPKNGVHGHFQCSRG